MFWKWDSQKISGQLFNCRWNQSTEPASRAVTSLMATHQIDAVIVTQNATLALWRLTVMKRREALVNEAAGTMKWRTIHRVWRFSFCVSFSLSFWRHFFCGVAAGVTTLRDVFVSVTGEFGRGNAFPNRPKTIRREVITRFYLSQSLGIQMKESFRASCDQRKCVKDTFAPCLSV